MPDTIASLANPSLDPRTGKPYVFGGVSDNSWSYGGDSRTNLVDDNSTGAFDQFGVYNYTPEQLKSIGYNGSAYLPSGGGENAGTQQELDPAFLQFLQDKGYRAAKGYANNGKDITNDMYRGQFFDKSGNPVGIENQWAADDDPGNLLMKSWLAMASAGLGGFASAAVGGAGAGAEGLSGMDLAADAAAGTGNSITAAGGALGGTSAGGLSGMDLAADAMTGGNSIAGSATGVTPVGSMAGANAAVLNPADYSGLTSGASPVPSSSGALDAAFGGTAPSTSIADLSAPAYSDYGAGAGGVGGAGTSITSSASGMSTGLSGEAMAGTGVSAGGTGASTGVLGSGLTYPQVGQLASSIYGMYQGSQMSAMGKASDPFAPYRAGYAEQLAQLMKDPSSVTQQPGYKASMTAAEQALTRNMAAQGLTGSGAAAEALAKFGGQFQDKYWHDMISTLANLGGAGINNAGLNMQAFAAGNNTINSSINNLIKIWQAVGGGSSGGNSGWLTSLFASGG